MKALGSPGNRLLAALPAAEIARLGPSLEQTTCRADAVLVEFGRGTDYVYFPTTSLVVLIYTMEDGSRSGMGVIGNEGVVGISVFLGGEALPGSAVVPVAGGALRMRAEAMRTQFRRGGAFQRLLLRYTQVLMAQVSQTSVCRGLHSVEQRLARWLLMIHDRGGSDDLTLTQDSLAAMLGVRRESVSHAAGHLQESGSIRYLRGHVQVVDRPKLEQASCECYHVIEDEFDRLLGPDAIVALSRSNAASQTG